MLTHSLKSSHISLLLNYTEGEKYHNYTVAVSNHLTAHLHGDQFSHMEPLLQNFYELSFHVKAHFIHLQRIPFDIFNLCFNVESELVPPAEKRGFRRIRCSVTQIMTRGGGGSHGDMTWRERLWLITYNTEATATRGHLHRLWHR